MSTNNENAAPIGQLNDNSQAANHSPTKLFANHWLIAFITIFLLAGAGLAFERPYGSISGQIALEQAGFGIATYDMQANKVYAKAIGPVGNNETMLDRGVWVSKDGRFQINHLPIGEYQLRVKAPGFNTLNKYQIFVEEGKVTNVATDRMYLLEPSVQIASNQRVFTSKEMPSFWVNATGATEAVVKIYQKDLLPIIQKSNSPDSLFEFTGNLSTYKPKANPADVFKDEKPALVLTRKLEPDYTDWARANFKLTNALPKGDYIATVEASSFNGKKTWNAFWFSVTDLGLVIKQAQDKTIVRAINLNTLKAQSGVEVQLFNKDADSALLGKITTAADGFATLPLNKDLQTNSSLNLIAYAESSSGKAYAGIPFWNESPEQYLTYFYTERPIYRLGQTVYFKGISRLQTSANFQKPQANLPISLKIEDPDGNEIYSTQLKTSAHGTFHGTYEIPQDQKTGGYQIVMTYPNGSLSYGSFEVAQYKKPEYKVEVIPLAARVTAGTTFKARIKANYFFGAPVANAKVKYSVYTSTDWSSRYKLMPRPSYYAYFDDWEGEDEESNYYDDQSYSGDFVSEGFASTDESGEAIVEIPTKVNKLDRNSPYSGDYFDKRYKIQAEVTDLSRMTVVSSASASVSSADFVLFVQPKSYVYKNGETITAEVTAVDYDGKPIVEQKLKASLQRWILNDKNYTYKNQVLKSGIEVTTDAAGKAQVEIPTQAKGATDSYYIVLEGHDKSGHSVYDQSSVWLANEVSPFRKDGDESSKAAFQIKLDKNVYKPGDTVRAMLTAPLTGDEEAQAIVSVESGSIHDLKVVNLKGTAQLIELPVKESYAPNVYLTVTLVDKKHQLYNQSKLLKVSPENHFLKLAISTEKAKYKPGEEVTYTIQATHADGSPAKNVEVSLGIVDESIYSIRAEVAEDIKKFFFSKRYNSVQTLCSFPEENSGGPDKIEPRVRKDFRDTAAWFPDLKTDDKGIAKATFKLPDNLTSWRATARAISEGVDVGAETQNITATQDLLIRLALPRFFRQHDKGLITAIVHNYTDKTQKVDLALEASDEFKVTSDLNQKLEIGSEKAERYSWPVEVQGFGEATIKAVAKGQSEGDAIEMKIPLKPLALLDFVGKSGILSDEDEKLDLKISKPDQAVDLVYNLAFSASSIGPVLGNLNALIDYPYGCTEQTMSRLMPSVIAIKIQKDLGIAIKDEASKKFAEVYKQAALKLQDYQNDDGGWGWWKNDTSNTYLTAYVLEGLYLLKQSGYEFDQERVKRGVTWLEGASRQLYSQLNDPKRVKDAYNELDYSIDLAYMQYVLTLHGKQIEMPVQKWFVAQLNSLPPEALSFLTIALNNSTDKANAGLFYRALNKLANHTKETTDWDQTPALFKKIAVKNSYTYRFSGIESTALALRATLAMDADNKTKCQGIINWLLMQRDKDGWQNTKTTAQVLRALLEDEINNKGQGEVNFKVLSSLTGTNFESLEFNSQTLYEAERKLNLKDQVPNKIHLEKTGPGKLYFQSLLTYLLPLKPGQNIARKSLPEGLEIKRSFYKLVAKPMNKDGVIHFETKPIMGKVKAGETVLMKLEINTPVKLPYVLIEAPLPSGGEVISNDPRENLVDGANNDIEGDWGDWWWTHQDILDDKIAFFVSSLPAGKSTTHALVRMELPGEFQLTPVQLEGMYSKSVRAYSKLDTIKVVE